MSKTKKDKLGLQYGRLVVIDSIKIRGLGIGWKCRCECGNEIYASGTNLESGNTKSCGCLFVDTHTTHKKSRSRVYGIWKSMLQRCNNPNSFSYGNYGGRGIVASERWQTFENFFSDMGDPPHKYTLERVDNEKGYSPENCRWATYKDQLNNRRNNHIIEAFGRKQTLYQWCEEFKLPPTTLKNRLYRSNWPVEIALTEPPRPGRKLT